MGFYADRELEAMLDDLESDRIERKETFGERDKARQAICAFANDLPNHRQPGVLFIGARDDGTPSGLEITDRLITDLANLRSDGRILPLPSMTVEKKTLKGAPMAVVIVQPSDMPPVRFDGRIWIRTGSRRDTASEQDERILNEKRRHRNLPFDLRPIAASLDDLSKGIFENEYLPAAFAGDVLEANHRTYEEKLASTRMIVSPDDTSPTVLGILTLGKSPQDFLPGAYIQFIRIAGTSLTDEVADEERITGTLSEVLRRAEEKLSAHNRNAMNITGSRVHERLPDYPMAALQQLLYNAVLHRNYEGTNAPVLIYWYDDRVEIVSPGGPYGNVTIDNFGRSGITDYRNPSVAVVLKNLGFVQQFGRGIAIARNELEKNGNPPPTPEVDGNSVSWVLRKRENGV